MDIFLPLTREENHLLLVDGKGSSKEKRKKEAGDEIPQHMNAGWIAGWLTGHKALVALVLFFSFFVSCVPEY